MEWIKVSDKKPRHEGVVLLYHEYGEAAGIALGFYNADKNIFRDWNSNLPAHVSYWSYIIMPPREG